MARFRDEAFVQRAFVPMLQPGERILYTAYGVKPPHFLAAFVRGAALLGRLLFKEYVVGLTDRGRFLVLRFSGKLKVKEVREYFIGSVVGVAVKTAGAATQIDIQVPYRPFSARFPCRGTPWNRPHALAIAQSLERRRVMALPPG